MRFTKAQYEAYETRRTGRPPPAPAGSREKDIHNQILEFCKARQWIAFHGSTAQATARTIGEPDFIVLAPGNIYLIECKTQTGKLTTAQLGMQHWAKRLGHEIHIVRSFGEFVQVVTPTLNIDAPPGSSRPGSSSPSSSPPPLESSDSLSSSEL